MVTLVNRAKMTIVSTGTGPLTLGSAVNGYQSFAAAGVSTGDVVRYIIEDGDAWEIGLGTYSANTSSLSRSVSESSHAGAPIALSGKAVVFLGLSAADINARVESTDPRLSNAREWTVSTISQTEAEAGTATTRRAFTAQRVRQAVLGWWNGSSEKIKLDGIETGAQVNVGTNLGITGTGNSRAITSSTGGNVTVPVATTTIAGLMATGDKSKLDGIAAGAQVNTVTSVAGKTGAVALTKADIGLSNVDNTTDADKPVSTATQIALNGKVDPTDSRLTNAREWTASTISQTEAEAGSATTRRAFTAQRIRQAVLGWWNGSADKTKLEGIAAGAQVNVATNLTYAAASTTGTINSSTGTNATIPAATPSLAGLMANADKAKLDGIAAGAQVNLPTNLSVTGGTTAGPTINSSTGTNVTLPAASGSVSGVVTIGAQVFAGVKSFSSTITGSISGNAGTATTLQTARSINGTSFNGSAAITTASWGTARNLTIGNTAKTVNGAGNVSWTLDEIGVHDFTRLSSGRDFPNGTLIATDISCPNAANGTGAWFLEIRGNTYASQLPIDLMVQGYHWNSNLYLNGGAVSNGFTPTGMVVFGHEGVLKFWFPHQAYWQGFEVYCSLVSGSGRLANRVTSIANTGKPTSGVYMESAITNLRQSLHSGNYISYSPSLTGSGASGIWGIGISGNAATATALQTARSINGTNFNGSAAITTANWGTARTLTIGSTGKSVNGSGNVSWTLAEIGAAAASHSHGEATTSAGGFMSSSDKTKLNGIAAGAQVNVATNLGITGTGNSRTITSSTGTNVTIPVATSSTAGLMATGDKSKLDGIAAGAQVNVATNLGVAGGTTGGPTITSSTGSNATLPTASTTASGVVTTGAQSWAGAKTFSAVVTAPDFVTTSDARLKQDIREITDALHKLRSLQGITYQIADDPRRRIGLLAQDVQRVAPEAVLETNGILRLSYGNLVGLLVEAIKDLSLEVDQLKRTQT
ncbi:MAG: tail fiber domain-containing protein [Roseovarius sp.]